MRRMQARAAIIGGTGVGSRLASLGGRAICIPTPAGAMRGHFVVIEGVETILLKRHSVGHKVPPHKVNYHAMALGLRALGVRCCLATAAVGSLRSEWTPGTFVVPHDILDLTARNATLYDRDVVHTDFTTPLPARGTLLRGALDADVQVVDGGVYVCGNGPRYETPHEIKVLSKIGDLVGMTAATEAILMREAGIDYGLLAVVTNLACGLSETPLHHGEVASEMERIGETAVRSLIASVAGLRTSV